AQQLAARMAGALGERVVLGAPVVHIRQDAGSVTASTKNSHYKARAVVVAVPPPLCRSIGFDPSLPHERAELVRRMAMGAVIKVAAIYDEPFWRSEGFSGQAFSDDGPLHMSMDASPEHGPGVLVGLLGGSAGRWFSRADPVARREAVTACLARFFGPRAAKPVQLLEQDWSAEPYSLGGYDAHPELGALAAYGRALRAPYRCVHWAGAEAAPHWCGYMDGAVASGERAAAEVLDCL
ncbi:MAG: FAD-dependent oxidoreductase, partial [Actinobacteria bacterium]|nr:FAD-dependent oxidoreductase [Actinomycetota bacterium]